MKRGVSNNISEEDRWDLVIKPRPKLLDLNFRELFRYQDLIWLFIRRDFIAQYKQTLLGPLWHFIQPILTTLMFLLVFNRIAGIPTDGVHPTVFYMAGIILWNYFSLSLTTTSNTFVANAPIFGKVYFPRLIMPLSVILSNLIRFGIQFALLALAILFYHLNGYTFVFQLQLLAIPFILLLLAAMALGVGIIVSSLTTKYRDFTVLLTFVVQLAMYGTPVAYSVSFIEDKSYGWFIKLNPLSPIFEAFRFALFGKGLFTGMDIMYSIVVTIIVLVFGLLLFNRVEKSFMDTV